MNKIYLNTYEVLLNDILYVVSSPDCEDIKDLMRACGADDRSHFEDWVNDIYTASDILLKLQDEVSIFRSLEAEFRTDFYENMNNPEWQEYYGYEITREIISNNGMEDEVIEYQKV